MSKPEVKKPNSKRLMRSLGTIKSRHPVHRQIVGAVKAMAKSIKSVARSVLADEKDDPTADLKLSTRKLVRGLLKDQNALFHVRAPHNLTAPTPLITASSTVLAGGFNVDPVANMFNWSSWSSLFDEYKLTIVELHLAFTSPVVSGVVATEVQPLQMAVAFDPDSSGVTPASYRSTLEHVNSWIVPVTNTHPRVIRSVIPPFPAPTGAGSVVWANVSDAWPGCFQYYSISPTSSSTFFGTLSIMFEVVFRFRA